MKEEIDLHLSDISSLAQVEANRINNQISSKNSNKHALNIRIKCVELDMLAFLLNFWLLLDKYMTDFEDLGRDF